MESLKYLKFSYLGCPTSFLALASVVDAAPQPSLSYPQTTPTCMPMSAELLPSLVCPQPYLLHSPMGTAAQKGSPQSSPTRSISSSRSCICWHMLLPSRQSKLSQADVAAQPSQVRPTPCHDSHKCQWLLSPSLACPSPRPGPQKC